MTELYLPDVEVAARYSTHRCWPWRLVKRDSTFPKRVTLTPGCTRWKLSDLEAWEAAKASEV